MIYMHLTLYLPGPTYLIYLPTCFSICCPVVSVYNVYVTGAYLHTGRTYDNILYWYTDTRDINVYFMYHLCASTHASETDIQSLFRSDVASLKTWLRDRYLRIVEQATGAASSQDRTRSGSCCYSTLRLTPVTYCHAGFVLCLGKASSAVLTVVKPVKPNKAYVILCCSRKWSCQKSRPRLSDTVEMGAGLEVLLAKYFK